VHSPYGEFLTEKFKNLGHTLDAPKGWSSAIIALFSNIEIRDEFLHLYTLDQFNTVEDWARQTYKKTSAREKHILAEVINSLLKSEFVFSINKFDSEENLRIISIPIEIYQIILEINNLEISKAKLVAKIAQGSIGNAYRMVSDSEFFNRRDELLGSLAEIIPGKIDCEIFNRKEKMFSDISRSGEILNTILLWYRDLLLIKELNCQKYVVNDDKLKILDEKAKLYSKNILIDILDYLIQIQEYMKRNANKNIIFESLIIKLSGVIY